MSSEFESEFKAAQRRRGLGKGLSVLLGSDSGSYDSSPGASPRQLPIELLHPSPFQPRRRFDETELDQLAGSIRAKGVMQPLLVRASSERAGQYEIIAGERRWRAAQRAGLHELPVVVHSLSDRDTLEVALLENVQRQDLSPLEEAEGYQRLVDEFGHTQQELADGLGKSRSHVANMLRLLVLPAGVRELLDSGALSAGHARALLVAEQPMALARIVVAKGLNVRQTEALVRAEKAARGRPEAIAGQAKDADTAALERELSRELGLEVKLAARGQGGVVSISYRSLDQLDGLLRRLR